MVSVEIPTLALLSGMVTLFLALFGFTVNYIISSFKNELLQDRLARSETMKIFGEKVDKVERFLEKIADEMFKRMTKAEKDIDTLWAEHDLLKEGNGCGLHNHYRKEDP
jgi:hypothetical protein